MNLEQILASHPDLPIPESTLAEARGVCVRTVQRQRAQRTGPAYLKIGKQVFYRAEAIREWLVNQEIEQPRVKGGR